MVVAGFAVYHFSRYELFLTYESDPAREEVDEFTSSTHLKLPPSAKVLVWADMGRQGTDTWLKVRMRTADVKKFLADSPFKGVDLNPAKDQISELRFSRFWDNPPTRYLSGEKDADQGVSLTILIDDTDPVNTLVYLDRAEM